MGYFQDKPPYPSGAQQYMENLPAIFQGKLF